MTGAAVQELNRSIADLGSQCEEAEHRLFEGGCRSFAGVVASSRDHFLPPRKTASVRSQSTGRLPVASRHSSTSRSCSAMCRRTGPIGCSLNKTCSSPIVTARSECVPPRPEMIVLSATSFGQSGETPLEGVAMEITDARQSYAGHVLRIGTPKRVACDLREPAVLDLDKHALGPAVREQRAIEKQLLHAGSGRDVRYIPSSDARSWPLTQSGGSEDSSQTLTRAQTH